MGLFGKKKEKVNENVQALAKFGYQENTAKAPERMTRKEAANQAQAKRESQVKKDQLLEGLNGLRRMVYYEPLFENQGEKVDELISKLKSSVENDNKEVLGAVDMLIDGAIKEAINYCSRGNRVAMSSCLSNIKSLISDRGYGGIHYANPEYCEYLAQSNHLKIEKQSLQAEFKEKLDLLEEYKQQYYDPAFASDRENIRDEVERIKEELDDLSRTIHEIDAEITTCTKSLNQLRKNVISHANDKIFDKEEKANSIIEKQRQNERDAEITEKLNSKLSESHRRVSSNALNVNEDAISSNEKQDLGEDFFTYKR